MGVKINEAGHLDLPVRPSSIMVTMPKTAPKLLFFSARLTEWLQGDSPRLLLLSDWNTFDFQVVPFTKMRIGCGETRTLAEAPGHLFDTLGEEEAAVMSGLIFSILAFDWYAYAVGRNRVDFIYLGDEYLIFSSVEQKKLDEARELIETYNLNVIQSNREAWK
jgi:hypothetical protein